MKIFNIIFLSGLMFLVLFSCKKFIEIPPPPNELVSKNVFTSDASAIAAMVGAYSRMMTNTGFASGAPQSITQLAGLSADEFINYSTDPNQQAFYKNTLTSSNSVVDLNLWDESYSYIYSANAVLEGLQTSTGITDNTKNQLEGEAKFLRAFCHFYLVNLFGDVPLVTSTTYQVNSVASRMPASTVYNQIIADLKDAQAVLNSDYSFSNGERVQPNLWAATALLARVYLYIGNWTEAVTQSTSIINNASLYQLIPDLDSVFLKNSSEAIWQLMPVQAGYNTNEGQTFVLTGAPDYISITPELQSAFEIGDQRRLEWMDSISVNNQLYYFAYKYKVKSGSELTEYSMVLRLAEQYLIRAEAEAQLNDLTDATNDLNIIRTRASLPPVSAVSSEDLLTKILQERRVELFSEWGHRWFDLKRYQLGDQVLGPIKSPGWKSTDTLYPIPKTEIINDPNLTQNPGY